jgi:hypothetical protein
MLTTTERVVLIDLSKLQGNYCNCNARICIAEGNGAREQFGVNLVLTLNIQRAADTKGLEETKAFPPLLYLGST